MRSTGFVFLGALPRPTVSSRGSTFVCSSTIIRKTLLRVQKERSRYLHDAFPRCAIESEQNEYIVDAEGSVFEMDVEDINLEEVEFPEGLPMLNSVHLTGRLGADPILRTIREGLEICKFSLAVQHEYDPTADPDDNTSWFDIEVWGGLGRSVASRIKKGIRVGIIGSIDVNTWTNRDGELVESPIVTATSVEVLQSRSEAMPSSNNHMNSQQFGETNSSYGANSKYSGIQIDGDLQDLPF